MSVLTRDRDLPVVSRSGMAALDYSPRGPSRARILVVEDETDIADLVRHALERDGHGPVEVVTTGDEALRSAIDWRPDLIVLDLNLPVLSGFDVCRILRARPGTSSIPIVILTARAAETDRVSGLDLGADDFITKPFSLRELTARVRAVLRRARAEVEPPSAVYEGPLLRADFEGVAISVAGRPVDLTRREFDLLRCLVENRNRVLTRGRLLERVWGHDRPVEDRSVDVHMGRLRAKLGPAAVQIETVIGIGYRFTDQ